MPWSRCHVILAVLTAMIETRCRVGMSCDRNSLCVCGFEFTTFCCALDCIITLDTRSLNHSIASWSQPAVGPFVLTIDYFDTLQGRSPLSCLKLVSRKSH